MGIKHKPTQIKNVPVIYDLLTSPTLVNLNPCITINGKKHSSLSLKKPSSKTNYLYLILQKSIKNPKAYLLHTGNVMWSSGGSCARTRKKFSNPYRCLKKALMVGSPLFTIGALKKNDNGDSTVPTP